MLKEIGENGCIKSKRLNILMINTTDKKVHLRSVPYWQDTAMSAAPINPATQESLRAWQILVNRTNIGRVYEKLTRQGVIKYKIGVEGVAISNDATKYSTWKKVISSTFNDLYDAIDFVIRVYESRNSKF